MSIIVFDQPTNFRYHWNILADLLNLSKMKSLQLPKLYQITFELL